MHIYIIGEVDCLKLHKKYADRKKYKRLRRSCRQTTNMLNDRDNYMKNQLFDMQVT